MQVQSLIWVKRATKNNPITKCIAWPRLLRTSKMPAWVLRKSGCGVVLWVPTRIKITDLCCHLHNQEYADVGTMPTEGWYTCVKKRRACTKRNKHSRKPCKCRTSPKQGMLAEMELRMTCHASTWQSQKVKTNWSRKCFTLIIWNGILTYLLLPYSNAKIQIIHK